MKYLMLLCNQLMADKGGKDYKEWLSFTRNRKSLGQWPNLFVSKPSEFKERDSMLKADYLKVPQSLNLADDEKSFFINSLLILSGGQAPAAK